MFKCTNAALFSLNSSVIFAVDLPTLKNGHLACKINHFEKKNYNYFSQHLNFDSLCVVKVHVIR